MGVRVAVRVHEFCCDFNHGLLTPDEMVAPAKLALRLRAIWRANFQTLP